MTNIDSILRKRDISLSTKVHLVKAMVFPVVIYRREWIVYIEALKNWCFWTVVLEKTLESPLDCKKIQPVHPKRDQSWVFIGRNDAESETPILWPSHAKNWLIGKDPDAGKAWMQEEKGTTEDEMVGWHHQLDGHEFGWSWWWTGRPGVLRFMGSQRVGHDWATELNWSHRPRNALSHHKLKTRTGFSTWASRKSTALLTPRFSVKLISDFWPPEPLENEYPLL